MAFADSRRALTAGSGWGWGALRALLASSICFGQLGCSEEAAKEDPLGEPEFSHAFAPLSLEPGYEDADTCLSWTLNNDEDFWVQRVDGLNDGGWHHSNWLWVSDDTYDGPDGAWPCNDRDFDIVRAGLNGGVFFAQSTQSTHDVQQFPEGAAFKVPARSRIVGQVHLLNTSPSSLSTGYRFEVRTLPEAEVTQKLHPISMTNLLLEIPARSKVRFDMSCPIAPAYQERLGVPPNFEIFYVLPHYHDLGSMLRVSMAGGANDGKTIFQTNGSVGEPLGATLDPPLRFEDAEEMMLSCEYDNPRDEAVGYGIGDQEMCVFLAFSNSPLTFAATSLGTNLPAEPEDSVEVFDTPCVPIAVQQD